MKILLTDTQKALDQTANLLAIPAQWLNDLINFESSFNPLAKNKITGARGLIQFLHKTAQSLGFLNADDLVNKYPGVASQITGPVYQYLKKFKPFPNKQSLYMSVFYPAARTWTPDTTFPANVRAANQNIDTVQDYIDHVEGKADKKKTALSAAGFFIIAGALFLTYKQFNKRKNRSWPPTTTPEISDKATNET